MTRRIDWTFDGGEFGLHDVGGLLEWIQELAATDAKGRPVYERIADQVVKCSRETQAGSRPMREWSIDTSDVDAESLIHAQEVLASGIEKVGDRGLWWVGVFLHTVAVKMLESRVDQRAIQMTAH